METRVACARAESFLSWNVSKLYFGAEVKPNWIGRGERFWYRVTRRAGTEFVLVDVASRTRRPAFDHVRLAAALSTASGTPCEAGKLRIESIEFSEDGGSIRFGALGAHWRFDLERGAIAAAETPRGPRPGQLLSPDGRWAAFVRDYNVHVRDTASDETFALTTDGEPHCGYACRTEAWVAMMPGPTERAPVLAWSPDSKRILTHRIDERDVGEFRLLQSVPPDGSRRPLLHSYRWPMAGDEHGGLERLVLLDVEKRSQTAVRHEPMPLSQLSSSVGGPCPWWGDDSRHAYVVTADPGCKTVRLQEIDASSGKVREVLTESSETCVDPLLLRSRQSGNRMLRTGREILRLSERDGWAHLYLHDGATGALVNQVTRGSWVVRDISHVDDACGLIYLTAGGKEQGRNPYLRHLYRVRLDGTGLELLTPEDADHAVSFSPDGSCFVDNHSRIDSPPVSVLRSSSGELLMRLEESDLRDLMATGRKYPERFSARARDGVTDIYGLICRPTSYDPAGRYPVVDVAYPGPSSGRTPVRFPTDPMEGGYFWDLQAVAELGFIVVTIDGLGTPYRSKAIRDYCYGKLEDCGLEDHIAALRQLAGRDASMDLSRVGIFGHSAGGHAATRAILAHPDFYTAAVSSAGVQDYRNRFPFVMETWQAYPPDQSWERQDNSALAANLRGHLLLACGDMDACVHISETIKLVDALIKANKDFDLVILPNRIHQYYRDVYFLRRMWDHFTRHLLGAEPPRGYQIRPAPP